MNGLLIAGIIVISIFILYFWAIMPRVRKRPEKQEFLQYHYAHRGFHDNGEAAPENSMAAFLKAVEKGYGIELDVQLSKDKVPIVFHDETLKRVCSKPGKVKDYTYEELKQFPLASSIEIIPRFQDVLAMVGGKVPIIVEIKCADGKTAVCKYAYELLKEYHGLYCVESFHPFAVWWFRKNAPWLLRGQLSSDYAKAGTRNLVMKGHGYLLYNFLSKPDFIAYDCKYSKNLSRMICTKIYKALSVAWTVRSKEQLEGGKKEYDLFIFEDFEPKS